MNTFTITETHTNNRSGYPPKVTSPHKVPTNLKSQLQGTPTPMFLIFFLLFFLVPILPNTGLISLLVEVP